ncbi:MAG: TolC family outer membrane protein, partial [Gemmatimonadota bacterium]
RAETAATQEEIPKARAGLLPQVSLAGTFTRNDLELRAPNLFGQISTNHFSYPSEVYAAQLRQPLFRYSSYAQLSYARAQAGAATAQQSNERQQLAVKVAESYFSVLLGLEQVRLAVAERAAYEATLASAERSFQAGAGTLTDIADARARRDQANAKIIEARNALAKVRRQLEAKIGESVGLIADLDPTVLPLVPPAPDSSDEWVARAYATSAEIEAAQKNLELARADVLRQKGQHLPTVDVIGAYQKASNETTSSLNQRSLSSFIGVQVSIPVYSGGGVQASVRQALDRQEKAEDQLEALKRDVSVRVREQFDNVVQGIESVRAYEQTLRSAEEAHRATQKGIQAGTRTSVDLLNAEAKIFDARQALAQARLIYVLSRLRLLAFAGSLTDDEVGHVNAWLGTATAVPAR